MLSTFVYFPVHLLCIWLILQNGTVVIVPVGEVSVPSAEGSYKAKGILLPYFQYTLKMLLDLFKLDVVSVMDYILQLYIPEV